MLGLTWSGIFLIKVHKDRGFNLGTERFRGHICAGWILLVYYTLRLIAANLHNSIICLIAQLKLTPLNRGSYFYTPSQFHFGKLLLRYWGFLVPRIESSISLRTLPLATRVWFVHLLTYLLLLLLRHILLLNSSHHLLVLHCLL
jgi:hypothetical protein